MGKERDRQRGEERREGVKTKWEGGERKGMIMSPTSDTSSCFYGNQGANRVALLRTVLLRADKRVERDALRCISVFIRGSKITKQISCRLSSYLYFQMASSLGTGTSKNKYSPFTML